MKIIVTLLLVAAFCAGCGESGPPLDAAAVERGKKLIANCKPCHAIQDRSLLIGPTLYGIVGSPAGKTEGYQYSAALASSSVTWNEAELAAFISQPDSLIENTNMAATGLTEQEAKDIVEYLKSVGP